MLLTRHADPAVETRMGVPDGIINQLILCVRTLLRSGLGV